MRAKELASFILARECARMAKEGVPLPKNWKPDPIIAQYRFCNVRREDDRVSKYIRQWAQRWAGHKDQWFCFVVARLFNLPSTLDMIATAVVPFKPEKMRPAVKALQADGQNIFNAAYIVSTNGRAMDKVDYVIDHVLAPIWTDRKRIQHPASLSALHESLKSFQGMGSFMAAQVVADLKYEPPYFSKEINLPTAAAEDWYTFAASGPGSRRGLNAVMGRAMDAPYRESCWRADLEALHKAVTPLLPAAIGAMLHRQDLQNCLCEFSKYEKARTGAGRPKQLYTPFQA